MTEVLGAILVFGLVLAVLALVQVSGIPAANEQVEFEHSQRVAGDFQSLDESVDAAATRGSLGSTGVEAGVRYPNRLFFINPGPVGGSLLSDSIPVDLNGFEGTELDESDDYLISDTGFTTTSLRYQAGYNEYANAPTLYYENGVVFERYENDDGTIKDIVVDGGSLVNGNRISVITTAGDFSTQVPGEISVNVVPVSMGTRPVTVVGSDAELVLETRLSEGEWVSILRNQFDANATTGVPADCDDVSVPATPEKTDGKYIIDCTYTAPTPGSEFGELTLAFENGSYDLRMAKVGLTTNDNQNPAADFEEEAAQYLVSVGPRTYSIVAGQSVDLVVEGRDQFNNPVSGESVTFDTPDGNLDATTGVDGRASATVASSAGSDDDITVVATIGDGTEQRMVTFTVEPTVPTAAGDGDGNGGDGDGANPGGSINPYDREGSLVLTDVSRSGNRYDLRFFNNADRNLTATDAQLNFYFAAAQGGSTGGGTTPGVPKSARFGSTSGDVLLVRGPAEDIADITVPAGKPLRVPVYFYDRANGTGPYGTGGQSDHFFVFTWMVDGRANLYFASEGQTPTEPVAKFTVTPESPFNTTEVTLDANLSTDGDGNVTSYEWDFDGDGSVDLDTPDSTVERVFPTPGTYDVTLVVVDNDGLESQPFEIRVTVRENLPPAPAFEFTPTDPEVGETVTFDASASTDPDGSIADYRWSFGDGATATGPTPTVTYSYAAAGDRTVTLTVVDEHGGSRSASQMVPVGGGSGGAGGSGGSATLDVVLTNDKGGNAPDTYTLTAGYAGGTASGYEWDFDDDGNVDRTTSGDTTAVDYRPNQKPSAAAVTVTGNAGPATATAAYP